MRDRQQAYYIFLAAVFSFVVQGCAAIPRVAVTDATLLSAMCERGNISWQWDSVTQVIVLHGANLEARTLVGSNVVIIGQEKIILSGPIKRSKNSIRVPVDFEKLVIERLKGDRGLALVKFRKIIIDAGHGGKDPGAIGKSGLREKEVVLDIALKLKDTFKIMGRDVRLTREVDEFLTLEQRTEIAARSSADLFVSIHANANRSRNVNGIEIYSAKEHKTEIVKEDQYKKNRQIFFNHKAVEKNAHDVEKILLDMLYSYKQPESKKLASFMTTHIAAAVGMKNGGHKSANFFVLRNTFIPAVLVEVGYLSNSNEEKLLETNSYRQTVAQSIAQTILDYEKL